MQQRVPQLAFHTISKEKVCSTRFINLESLGYVHVLICSNYLFCPSFSGIYAYVTLKEHTTISPEQLRVDLRNTVKKRIGSFATPELIQVWYCLLHSKFVFVTTRSVIGKIDHCLRRYRFLLLSVLLGSYRTPILKVIKIPVSPNSCPTM